MRHLHLLFASCIASFGCNVAAFDDRAPEPTKNQCSANAECADGVCAAGICQARKGTFTTLLFEVTAPADAEAIAGVRFFKRLDQLDATGGQQDLAFDRVAQVSGFVQIGKASDQNCVVNASIPAHVTFTPAARFWGLSVTTYTATTRLEQVTTASGASLQQAFHLNLPAGDYDVYVQAATDANASAQSTLTPESCAIVPKLFQRVHVEAGIVRMPLALGIPARLILSVLAPSQLGANGLDGWSIDIVEPESGKIISTQAILGQAYEDKYTATLYYSPLQSSREVGRELVRVSPPAATDAPTILVQRSSLELFDKGWGVIDQLLVLPTPVTVDAELRRKGTGRPVPASISLVATQLNLRPGILASFRQAAQADSQGRFQVRLLPGKYRVYAVPPAASGAAATETELSVSASPEHQTGTVIELNDTAKISGGVLGPAGQPISGASVHAAAAPTSINVSLLDSALGGEPFVPRAWGCSGRSGSCTPLTDEAGYFSIEGDPGIFDVSVRPPEESAFAWLVRPSVELKTSGEQLGRMQMPLPVVYRGSVSTAEIGTVSGAQIRAYIYVDEKGYTSGPAVDAYEPATVLQVAETRAQDDGGFELLVPATLE